VAQNHFRGTRESSGTYDVRFCATVVQIGNRLIPTLLFNSVYMKDILASTLSHSVLIFHKKKFQIVMFLPRGYYTESLEDRKRSYRKEI
jgi:hypothetical protein